MRANIATWTLEQLQHTMVERRPRAEKANTAMAYLVAIVSAAVEGFHLESMAIDRAAEVQSWLVGFVVGEMASLMPVVGHMRIVHLLEVVTGQAQPAREPFGQDCCQTDVHAVWAVWAGPRRKMVLRSV